jgi:hypothetical protein
MGASVVAARGADLTRGIPTKRLFSEAATRYSARPDLFDRRTLLDRFDRRNQRRFRSVGDRSFIGVARVSAARFLAFVGAFPGH